MKFSENAITDDSEIDIKCLNNAQRANQIATKLRNGDTTTIKNIDSNRGLIGALASIAGLRIWEGRRHFEITRVYGGES